MGLPLAAIFSAGASLLGAGIQAGAARSATRAQERAAQDQLALQREVYADQTERFAPFLGAGTNALGAYQHELGLGARPEGWAGLALSPGAQFAMEQGRDTMEAGAAGRGGLHSGATLAGLERMRMGMAAQDRDNQLNRLAGLVDMGQGAAGMQASAGNAFANMGSTSLANMGNAQSAGAIAGGNAWAGGINNMLGAWQYQQALNQPSRPGQGIFGGNSWG